METAIRHFLTKECEKQIRRHGESIKRIQLNRLRVTQRTGVPPPSFTKGSYRPDHWNLNPHFDPYHVRSKIDWIAKGIAKSFSSGKYTVTPAYKIKVSKNGGGFRDITIFTLPDSAVANFFYKRLLSKNLTRFSSYSYAYRSDRNRHMAIDHLERMIKSNDRLYLLEYDFKNYFDSISHEYIDFLLRKELNASLLDRTVTSSFLKYSYAPSKHLYQNKKFENNQRGIPLGSSLSLFLANAACLELDRDLESTGCTFARFSDDTAVLCQRYDQVNDCAKIILAHKARAGVEVNYKKSPGISLLTLEENAELKNAVSSFDYVGYKVGFNGISIRPKSVGNIKKTIGRIIYRHLLLYPRMPKTGFYSSLGKGQFNVQRILPNGDDLDLLSCIKSIRRYIYGLIHESDMHDCILTGQKKAWKISDGILSRYPMVNNSEIMRELDGWLIDVVKRAMKERNRILFAGWPNLCLRQYAYDQLLTGDWYLSRQSNYDANMPSFFLAWCYTRKLVNVYGSKAFSSAYYV